MKLFTNLPGNLRALFGFLRLLVVLLGLFWFFSLTLNPWIQRRFTDDPKLIVSVGEVSLQTSPGPIQLDSNSARPGSLALTGLRGMLQMDLLSGDAALVSALRWTMFPAMAVFVAFSWLLFGALRSVCANIERGEVFSENNLRLLRNVGIIMIGYSVVAFVVQLWASHIMNGYLTEHVAATAAATGLEFARGMGALKFSLPTGQFPSPGGVVSGCLVLVICEAFRQGLVLKNENDLTV